MTRSLQVLDAIAALLQRFTLRVDLRFIDRSPTIAQQLITSRHDDWLSADATLDELAREIEREMTR